MMDVRINNDVSTKSRGNRVIKRRPASLASRWNIKLLRGLQRKLEEDPEADITALLPNTYAETLLSYKKGSCYPVFSEFKFDTLVAAAQNPQPAGPQEDIRSKISPEPFAIISELSSDLKDLLEGSQSPSAVIELLQESERLYEGAGASSGVFRVSKNIIVKITNKASAFTEIGSLQYIQTHLPTFPAPQAHGLIQLGLFWLLFTSFVPGIDLEKAWPRLDETGKKHVSAQLDSLLNELRSLPKPRDQPLGGVQMEGCKDARRGVRVSKSPITNPLEFQDFIFSGSRSASPVYRQLLRDLAPASSRCVFTHGDIRPANIMVGKENDGTWTVSGIIDWEASGFYPEYWESVKMTNNLTPRDNDDWYWYLPKSCSPRQYATQWLVDRLWDQSMDNS